MNLHSNTESLATEFLAIASQFQLGSLDTESCHPLTRHLSDLVKTNIGQAVEVLRSVDLQALKCLLAKSDELSSLASSVQATLAKGNKVFLCGCGATGRLSLSLEVFCREGMVAPEFAERFIAFMAGGDTALVRSIEHFEDHPEFGARQLQELGFTDGDLLISTTEGGETPFVIGATLRAAELSTNAPWFLYCNPDDQLIRVAARSQQIIEDPHIRKINLSVGPMAISGSTRMQSSTVLMLGVGLTIAWANNPKKIRDELEYFIEFVTHADFSPLAFFIENEFQLYQENNYLTYSTNDYGITLLTDTTERSPTFSLIPFENLNVPTDPKSLCYLSVPTAPNPEAAWSYLLKRSPRTLEWEGFQHLTGYVRLNGFDISSQTCERRRTLSSSGQVHLFTVNRVEGNLEWSFAGEKAHWQTRSLPLLLEHTFLKLLLNINSTLLMGKLNRYEGNLMTWVKPSNQKLIDRSARYVLELLRRQNITCYSYAEVVHAIFAERETLRPDEPIVLKVVARLVANKSI